MKKLIRIVATLVTSGWLGQQAMGAEFIGWQETVPAGSLKISQIDEPGTIGDIYLIQAPDGMVTLLDTGVPDAGESILIPALERRGIRKIDQIVITHQHEDHTGGLPTLLADPEIKVGCIIWSPFTDQQIREHDAAEARLQVPLNHSILTLAKQRGIPVRSVNAGDIIHFGSGVEAKVLCGARPDVKVRRFLNNNSVVFRLTYKDFSVLFTGDQGFEEEETVMASGECLRSDVLKVGHHGGAGSTGEEFLKAVDPKIAMVTMPVWLSSEPHAVRVEKLLKARQCPFFRSWEYGDLDLFSDGRIFGLVKFPIQK